MIYLKRVKKGRRCIKIFNTADKNQENKPVVKTNIK